MAKKKSGGPRGSNGVPEKDAGPASDPPRKGGEATPGGEDTKEAIEALADKDEGAPDARPADEDPIHDEIVDASEAASPPSKHAPPAGDKAAWGEPIARFEQKWTWLESRLITFVLVWQLLALVSWVMLSGASSPKSAENAAGWVFRAIAGAVVLGAAAWALGRKQPPEKRRLYAFGATVVGVAVASLWRNIGVEYFDNVKAWLQEGSTLTLLGGLRGLGTRLTLWLALLGASLATAAGKHINIDVVYRFLPVKARRAATVITSACAAAVCFAAVWGFFDHIAIVSYGAKADASASEKIAIAQHELGESAFLTRKQIGLDLRSLPKVLAGKPYLDWMTAAEWNAWVREGGFESHYTKQEVDSLIIPEDAGATHAPLVISPDGTSTRGMLAHDLNLVFPFGMLVIGLRFLIRILLTLSGHIGVDPDAAHKPDGPAKDDGPKAAEGTS